MDFTWMPQLAAAVAVIATYTLLVRRMNKYEFLQDRIRHEIGMDESGNMLDKKSYRCDSDVVRDVVNRSIKEGSIRMNPDTKRGA
jgi:hypothetical protein